MNLKGKVAIVTGGAQGIGRAIVESFAQAGAFGLVVADMQAGEAEAVAQSVGQVYGGQAMAVPTDVSNPAHVEAMVQATLERFGRVDILVNNAGVCPITAWEDVTVESWNRILAVNLTGTFLCTQAVIPHMRTQKHGRIVCISSEAAFVGSYVAHVAYGVSKAGILAFVKSVAKGFAADGILANAVTPGPVDTPLAHGLGREFWTSSEQNKLLKRHASAKEVADAVLFLVSDRSTYVTGQVLRVNGGSDLA